MLTLTGNTKVNTNYIVSSRSEITRYLCIEKLLSTALVNQHELNQWDKAVLFACTVSWQRQNHWTSIVLMILCHVSWLLQYSYSC